MNVAFPIDFSSRCKFVVGGTDAVRFLNGQLTANIPALPPGRAIPACLLDAKGKLQAELMVRRTGDDRFWLDAPGELREPLGARLERYVIADDVVITDCTEEWQIVYDESSAQPMNESHGVEMFPSLRMDSAQGRECWLDGTTSLPSLFSTDDESVEAVRITRLLPKWGSELDNQSLPGETSLVERAVDFSKGCYIGQEVVSRMKSVGHPSRRLMLLEVVDEIAECRVTDLVSMPLLSEGEAIVGSVTSAVTSPANGKTLILAYVKWAYVSAPLHLCLLSGSQLRLVDVCSSSHHTS